MILHRKSNAIASQEQCYFRRMNKEQETEETAQESLLLCYMFTKKIKELELS